MVRKSQQSCDITNETKNQGGTAANAINNAAEGDAAKTKPKHGNSNGFFSR